MLKVKNKIVGSIKSKESLKSGISSPIIYIEPLTQEKTIIPTKEHQEVIPDENYTGLNKVTVAPIPEEYIIPEGTKEITENATYDVTKFARVSARVYPTPNLQDKEVTPTKDLQAVTSDDGYDGLNNVTVNAIPSEYIVPSGVLNISENGTKDVTNYAEVNVNVETTVSGGSTLNVFTQEDEPETKEGIWLQTSEKYDSVSLRDNPFETKLTGRPQLSFDIMNNAGVLLGNYVYMFGGDVTSSTRSYVYKYDLTNNSYVKLSNMPFITAYKPAIAIGTDIYICGYYSSTNVFYKFDTITETYTRLANEPISLEFSCLVNVGDYIYAIGGTHMKNNMYKYSISNNTWTLMSSKLPELFSQTSGFVIGTDIYLVSTCLAGYASTQHNYVFDTITETFRTLPSVSPEGFVVVATLVEDNFVYLKHLLFAENLRFDLLQLKKFSLVM